MKVNEVKSVVDLRERTSDKTTNDGAYEVQAVALANADIIAGLQLHFINNIDYEMGMKDGSINISSTGNGISAKDIGKLMGILDGKTNFAMKSALEDVMFMVMMTLTQATDEQRSSRFENATSKREMAYKMAYTTFQLKQTAAKKDFEATEKEVEKEIKSAQKEIIMGAVSIGVAVLSAGLEIATVAIQVIKAGIKTAGTVAKTAAKATELAEAQTAKVAQTAAETAAEATTKGAKGATVAGDAVVDASGAAADATTQTAKAAPGAAGGAAEEASEAAPDAASGAAPGAVVEAGEAAAKVVNTASDATQNSSRLQSAFSKISQKIHKTSTAKAEKIIDQEAQKLVGEFKGNANLSEETRKALNGVTGDTVEQLLEKLANEIKSQEARITKLKSPNDLAELNKLEASNKELAELRKSLQSLKNSKDRIIQGDSTERNIVLWANKGKHNLTEGVSKAVKHDDVFKKMTYDNVRIEYIEKLYGKTNVLLSIVRPITDISGSIIGLYNVKLGKIIAELRQEVSLIEAEAEHNQDFFNEMLQRTKEMQDAYLKSKKAVYSILDSLNMMQQQIQSTRLSLAIKI